jgi:hypothetical protein
MQSWRQPLFRPFLSYVAICQDDFARRPFSGATFSRLPFLIRVFDAPSTFRYLEKVRHLVIATQVAKKWSRSEI